MIASTHEQCRPGAAPGSRRRERRLIIFKWLLLPASVLVVLGVVVFIVADMERMKALRSVAAGS
jgi:hypothetical protein